MQVRGHASLLETPHDLVHKTDAISSRHWIMDDEKALPSARGVTCSWGLRAVHGVTCFPGARGARLVTVLPFELICRLVQADPVAK